MVDVVICTRNNRNIIARTLDSVARQTVPLASCTVVDGKSTDGTVDFIRQHYPWVHVIIKEEDSGPAASRNIGFAHGCAEFVLFVDSDVELQPQWLAAQTELMRRHARLALAGGKLLQHSRPDTLHAAHGEINRYGIAWEGGIGEPADAYTDPLVCLWLLSAANLARRSALTRIGVYDELMFATYEDIDIGWRATLAGYEVMFNPAAVAVHLVNQTLDPKTMYGRLIRLVWRNRIRGMLVNYELSSLIRYFSAHLVFALADALVYGPRRAKLGAIWWNILHLGDTLRRRRLVQALRTVPDASLWWLFSDRRRGPGYAKERYARKPVTPGEHNDRLLKAAALERRSAGGIQ